MINDDEMNTRVQWRREEAMIQMEQLREELK